jgi:hypothetical protein
LLKGRTPAGQVELFEAHRSRQTRPRQDANGEQEQLGEFVRRTGVCDRTVVLPRLDTAAKKASMKTISSATSLWNSGSWGANSSAALTSMQPRRCSSSTDRSMFSPKNVRIATDGRIDHGYRYSQLHARPAFV